MGMAARGYNKERGRFGFDGDTEALREHAEGSAAS